MAQDEKGADGLTPAGTGDDPGGESLLEDHADDPNLERSGQEAAGDENGDANNKTDQWDPMAEGWQDHPDVKSHVEAERKTAAASVQSDKDRESRELRADHVTALENATKVAIAGETVKQISASVKAIIDKVEDLTSVEEAESLLNRVLDDPNHTSYANVYDRDIEVKHQATGKQEGFRLARAYITKGLPAALVAEMEIVAADLQTAIKLKEVGTQEKAFETLLSARDERVRADERTKVGKMKSDREDSEDRHTEREKRGRPAEGGSGRGGSRRVTLSELSKMSRADVAALPKEARDRALASAGR